MLISKSLLVYLQPALMEVDHQTLEATFLNHNIEINQVYSHKPLSEVYYGQILSVQKHPKSTKLSICSVLLSNGQIRTIVCGAANVRRHLKVVVVQPGAVLPSGLEIGARNVLGVNSYGMICSYEELSGLDQQIFNAKDYDQVIELPDDFDLFQPFDPSYFGLDDVVYDLEIPTNRPDLNSAFGLVATLSSSLFLPTRIASYEKLINDLDRLVDQFPKSDLLEVKNNYSTNNFVALFHLKGVHIKKSSWCIRKLLLNNNITCVNNLVDYANLLTLMLNQPVHLHDADKLAHIRSISFDYATDQTFVGLNNQAYQLDAEDMVVNTDHNQPLALGGIIGSNDTAVDFNTKNCYLEVVNWNHENILKSSIKHQIHTPASLNNCKQKSNYFSVIATLHFLQFLNRLCLMDLVYVRYRLHDLVSFKFDRANLEKLWGARFDWELVDKHLTYAGYEIFTNQHGETEILQPAYRLDVNNLSELSDDIINYVDFNSLPEVAPTMEQVQLPTSPQYDTWKRFRQYWLDKVYYEAKTYNLQNRAQVQDTNFMNSEVSDFVYDAQDQASEVMGLYNKERTTLRVHGLNQLGAIIKHNNDQKNDPVSWFELSNIQEQDSSFLTFSAISVLQDQNPLNQSGYKYDLADTKTFVRESLLQEGITVDFILFNEQNYRLNAVFDPVSTHQIYDLKAQKVIGYLGQLSFNFVSRLELDLRQPLIGVFIKFDHERDIVIDPVAAPTLNIYPSSQKHISFRLKGQDKTNFNLNQLFTDLKAIEYVNGIKLTDIFTQEQLDCIDISFVLDYNGIDHTLTQNEIAALDQKVTQVCHKHELELL